MNQINCQAFDTTDNRWRKLIFLNNIRFAVFILLAEAIIALMLHLFGLIQTGLLPFLFRYLLLPTLLNGIVLLLGYFAVYRWPVSDLIKNYAVILVLVFFCDTVWWTHHIFWPTACTYIIPICFAVVFGDRKMTRNIMLLSLFSAILGMTYARTDGLAADPYYYCNCAIVLMLIFAAYIGCIILQQREEEKRECLERDLHAQNELAQQTMHDHLTKLYNLRAYYLLAESAIRETEENGGTLDLAVVDIDHFKNVNEAWGHEAGNAVLLRLGELLNTYCSAIGTVFRYGGEEFVIVFQNKEWDEIVGALELARQTFAATRFPELNNRPVTFSAGIAKFHHGETVKELFARAQQAMDHVKKHDRNQINYNWR